MKVFINYAAANRDPSAFPKPNEFKLDRPQKRHMSFGLGLHFCLGAPMARLEAQIAVKVLCDRLPEISLAGAGERIAPFFLWGRKRLPIDRVGQGCVPNLSVVNTHGFRGGFKCYLAAIGFNIHRHISFPLACLDIQI